jgi:hypothetical protein
VSDSEVEDSNPDNFMLRYIYFAKASPSYLFTEALANHGSLPTTWGELDTHDNVQGKYKYMLQLGGHVRF